MGEEEIEQRRFFVAIHAEWARAALSLGASAIGPAGKGRRFVNIYDLKPCLGRRISVNFELDLTNKFFGQWVQLY